MDKFEQIEKRMAEIKAEIDTEGADLDALETEINTLTEEKRVLTENVEKRKALMDKVAHDVDAPIIKDFKKDMMKEEERKLEFDKETVLGTKEYRSAWAKTLMCQPLNEVEKRALGTALTTTATTYVAASESVDGVNNGGLFIPDEVNLELMNELALASPFFADIPKTAIRGKIKFPYRKSGSGANGQIEGTANSDGQIEWADLTLTDLEVSETIRVSWKLEAMTVDGFIDYIIKELSDQINEKIPASCFYGDGSDDLTGATVGAINGEYTIGSAEGNVIDILGAIEAGIKLLPKRKKIGAKIYVAQDIIESVSFMRDSNDNFVYNPINGGGISSIATYQVAVDPFLNEGDFLIGNPKYYRFNTNEDFSITKDISGKNRINDYTAYALVSGAPQPSSFVYGKKSL